MEYLNKTVNSVNEEKYRLLTPITLQLFLYPTPTTITTITKEKKKDLHEHEIQFHKFS